jgi:hypothetical protein
VVYSSAGDPPAYVVGTVGGLDGPVTNIYPYAKDGTPLHDVLLYDQDGNPLVLTEQGYTENGELVRRFPYAPDGRAIQHAYPQEQAYQDSSTYPPILRRQQPPQVAIPQFATPTPEPTVTPTSTPTSTGAASTPAGKPAPRPTPTPSRSLSPR